MRPSTARVTLRGWHIATGLALAVVAHLSATWFWFHEEPLVGALATGEGGMSVAIASASSASVAATQPTRPPQPTETPSEPLTTPAGPQPIVEPEPIRPNDAQPIDQAEVEPVVELPAETPVAQREPQNSMLVEPTSVVEQVDLPEPTETLKTPGPTDSKPVETVVAQAKTPSPVKPVELETEVIATAERVEPETDWVPPRPAARPPPPEQTEPELRQVPSQEQPTESMGTAAARTEESERESESDITSAASSGSSDASPSSAAGGNPGARNDFMAQIAAILAANKRYPRRARSRRQEGVGTLHFVLDETGQLLDARLTESTGYNLLDDEILALAKRAEPFPPPPPEAGSTPMQMTVPIEFRLR